MLNLTKSPYPLVFIHETLFAVKLARTLLNISSLRLVSFKLKHRSLPQPLICSTIDLFHSQLVTRQTFQMQYLGRFISGQSLLASKALNVVLETLQDPSHPRHLSLTRRISNLLRLMISWDQECCISNIYYCQSISITSMVHAKTGPSQICSGSSPLHFCRLAR